MMRWRRMAAIALRYFYLLRGSPARVVPLFAWVGIDIVLWGFSKHPPAEPEALRF
jgi:ABC-2 type transport system permease protein